MAKLPRSAAVAIAALVVLLTQFAQPADAGTVTHNRGPRDDGGYCGYHYGPPVVRFNAAPGEVNKLTVLRLVVYVDFIFDVGDQCTVVPAPVEVAGLVLRDGGAPMAVAGGCQGGVAGAAVCQDAPLEVFLGDRNDEFTSLSIDMERLAAGPGSFVDAGNGDDTIRVANAIRDTVICGPGLDTVVADGRDWVDASCENVTRVSA